jgi:hypothetical protein
LQSLQNKWLSGETVAVVAATAGAAAVVVVVGGGWVFIIFLEKMEYFGMA